MAKSSKKDSQKKTGFSVEAIESTSLMQFLVDDMEEVLQTSITDGANHMPSIDMFSTDDYIYIDMNIPGVREEDLEIIFFKNTIKATAIKYECFDEKELNYICMERSFGKIQRIIEIPFPVNSSKIKAQYNHGVLTVTLPRVEEKRGLPITIKVETGNNNKL